MTFLTFEFVTTGLLFLPCFFFILPLSSFLDEHVSSRNMHVLILTSIRVFQTNTNQYWAALGLRVWAMNRSPRYKPMMGANVRYFFSYSLRESPASAAPSQSLPGAKKRKVGKRELRHGSSRVRCKVFTSSPRQTDATCCNIVGSCPNMFSRAGQTNATCCVQQCCTMLHQHVASVWPGLNAHATPNWAEADYIRVCGKCA